LLIALYAQANKYVLFYVPKVREHQQPSWSLRSIRLQNELVFEEEKEFKVTFESYAEQNTVEAAARLMGEVLGARDAPVFYIIDEHHEMFTPEKDQFGNIYYPYQKPFLRSFANWTRVVEF
jgi:hypothetical protein